MKYKRFEELPVWNDAIALFEQLVPMLNERAFNNKGDLRSQLSRAVLSVSNNIAEGFERGTTSELITFLYIARGSAGEVRSMLSLCERLGDFDHLKSDISNLKLKAEEIARQLRGWADSLQKSEITGQRYLTDATKNRYDQKSRAEAFMQKLRAMHEPVTDTHV
jgi:four helix bundle protein